MVGSGGKLELSSRVLAQHMKKYVLYNNGSSSGLVPISPSGNIIFMAVIDIHW